ncbi:MAG: tetratricopeptide repeat protein, partial [Chitinophagales bacterium]
MDSLMQVLEVSQEEKNQKTESKILLEIGKVFQGESKYEKALEYLDQATKIAEGINHYEVLHQSLKATALVNLSKGNYEDSYAYQSRLLNLFQSKQDSVKIAKTYYNIGSIFFYQEDFSKALEQYQTAMGIAESLKDSNVLYICNAAIGSVYGEKKDSRLSSAYNLRSLDIAEAMDYKVGIAYSARNLGLSYSAQKEYQKALGNFKRSLEIMHEMGNSSGESINLWSIGTTYSKLKEHKLALNHLEDALKIANKVGDKSHLREMYEDIAEAYFEAGKLVDAYQYQKKYVTLKDSLVNEERVKQMSDLQHQNELQQTELEVLKKDQQLQNMLKIFLGVSAFLLLLISTLLYSRYRLQTKSNGLLADANLAIQEQNKKLAATNSDLEKFAFIASHDLKEPLRMIGGYSSLIEKRYSANFSDNAKQFMGYINEAVERMYQLLDDLLAYSKLNIEEKSYEKFNMKKMVADLVGGIQENHPEAEIHVQNLPEKLLA